MNQSTSPEDQVIYLAPEQIVFIDSEGDGFDLAPIWYLNAKHGRLWWTVRMRFNKILWRVFPRLFSTYWITDSYPTLLEALRACSDESIWTLEDENDPFDNDGFHAWMDGRRGGHAVNVWGTGRELHLALARLRAEGS